jgi:hypothetical protein
MTKIQNLKRLGHWCLRFGNCLLFGACNLVLYKLMLAHV